MNDWTPIQTGHNHGRFETVDPGIIQRHKECQPRVDGTDPKVVAEYAMDMREYDADEKLKDWGIPGWKKFPHVYCVKTEDGKYILYSGFHRHDAILQVGYETVEVWVYDGTLQDAILLSKGENANNGVRRTNADKAHVVKSCLLDDELKQWSDRQIAEWCGVAPSTVKNHEEALSKLDSGYERPTQRKRLLQDGKVEWIETASIGNGASADPKPDAEVEKFYESHKAFQSAVSDFVALPSYGLDFTYSRRRIVAFIGLEDTGNAAEWELEKLQSQAHIRDEAKEIIQAKTNDEDTSHVFEEGTLAELLHEMKLIGRALERYSVLRPPQLREPLDDRTPVAVKRLENIFTPEWEALPSADRRKNVISLIELQPVLYSSECDKRDDQPPVEADRASIIEDWRNARKAVIDLWTDEIAQTIVCLDNFKDRIIEYYPSYIRKEVWNPGVDESLPNGVFIAETKQFKEIASDIESGADWVKAMLLYPDTELARSQGAKSDADAEDQKPDKPEKSELEQAKIDHSNACLRVQSAFFDTGLDKLDTEFPLVETGKKLSKFLDLIIKEKGLRPKIFAHNYFVYSPDSEHKEIHLHPWEIQDETETLDEIAKHIRFYADDDGARVGWVDTVIEKFKSPPGPTSDEPDISAIQKDIRDARNKADQEGGTVNFPTIAKRHGVEPDVVAEIAAKMAGGFDVPETPETEAKVYGNGTQGEFNTSENAENPAETQYGESPAKATESDTEKAQSEHVARLEALPGEIKAYIPTWVDTNFEGYTPRIILKDLLNARCLIVHDRERSSDPFFREEMEDLLERMKTNDQALIDKVAELLGIEFKQVGDVSHEENLEKLDAIEKQVNETASNGKSAISDLPLADLFAEIKNRIEEETDYNPRVVNDQYHNMKFNSLSYLKQIDDRAAKLWIIADLGKYFCDENSD